MRTLLFLIVLAGLLAGYLLLPGDPGQRVAPAKGEKLHISDGDSFRIGAQSIRLIGIDAPELHQSCTREDGSAWQCGEAAKAKLEKLAHEPGLSCLVEGTDRYDRLLATCSTDRTADIGDQLIADGLAIRYLNGAERYALTEMQARLGQKGIWAGAFEEPADWRRANRRRTN